MLLTSQRNCLYTLCLLGFLFVCFLQSLLSQGIRALSGWMLEALKDIKNKSSLRLLQYCWSYLGDKRLQNSATKLSIMEMNPAGNRNVLSGTYFSCWVLTLSSLVFNFFYHLQPPLSHNIVWPLLPQGFCCQLHPLFFLASALNTTDSLPRCPDQIISRK